MAGVCIAAGVHLGWLDSTHTESRVFGRLRISVGFAGLVARFYLINASTVGGPGVSWKPHSPAIMEEAKKLEKPVVMDFSAAWCAPCREMEHVTFRDPEIVKQANQFVMLNVDLTTKGNLPAEQLVRQYFVGGVPTIVFLNGLGKEVPELRVVGFIPADQFLNRMVRIAKIQKSSS